MFRPAAGNVSQTAVGTTKKSYTTVFPVNESSLSENGLWRQADPVNQQFAQTISGVAFGKLAASPTPPPYNDANAYMVGFGNDHEVEAVIYKDAGATSTPNTEVELLLRWNEGPLRTTAFGSSKADGYEININQNGDYLILGRYLESPELTRAATPPAVNDGDTIRARIEGQRIRVWYTVKSTGVETLQIDYTDNAAGARLSGHPGIGFYADNGGSVTQLGFKKVTLRAL